MGEIFKKIDKLGIFYTSQTIKLNSPQNNHQANVD